MHRGWAFTLWERSVRWRSTTFVISTPRSSLLSVDYGRNHTSVTFDGEEAYREKVGGFVPFILGPTAPTSLLEGQLSEVAMSCGSMLLQDALGFANGLAFAMISSREL